MMTKACLRRSEMLGTVFIRIGHDRKMIQMLMVPGGYYEGLFWFISVILKMGESLTIYYFLSIDQAASLPLFVHCISGY